MFAILTHELMAALSVSHTFPKLWEVVVVQFAVQAVPG